MYVYSSLKMYINYVESIKFNSIHTNGTFSLRDGPGETKKLQTLQWI